MASIQKIQCLINTIIVLGLQQNLSNCLHEHDSRPNISSVAKPIDSRLGWLGNEKSRNKYLCGTTLEILKKMYKKNDPLNQN